MELVKMKTDGYNIEAMEKAARKQAEKIQSCDPTITDEEALRLGWQLVEYYKHQFRNLTKAA